MNKKQEKEFNRYKKHLGITTKGEEFVLETILSFDWNRRCIIQEIETIKEHVKHGLIKFRVNLVAPSSIIDYSCSNPCIEWEGSDKNENERKSYVYSRLMYYLNI